MIYYNRKTGYQNGQLRYLNMSFFAIWKKSWLFYNKDRKATTTNNFLEAPLYLSTNLLMGGFILLTRGYGFMGGVYHPPFNTLKIGTFTNDIKVVRLAFLV